MERRNWGELIEEQRKSGQSVSKFCRERGIGENSLYYWRDKLKVAPAKFVQVNGKEPLEITLKSGAIVRVPSSVGTETLKALLEALSA